LAGADQAALLTLAARAVIIPAGGAITASQVAFPGAATMSISMAGGAGFQLEIMAFGASAATDVDGVSDWQGVPVEALGWMDVPLQAAFKH
jgi:hypothetical protein